MLSVSEIAAAFVIVGEAGAWLLRVDRFAHSPASLKKDVDAINKRLDAGNERYSTGMGKVNVKVEEVDKHVEHIDKRVVRLEALEEARHETPRPRTR